MKGGERSGKERPGMGRMRAAALLLCLTLLWLLCPSGAPVYAAEGKESAAATEGSVEKRGPRYAGNAKTGKYHNSSCRHFSCKNCVIKLKSPEEARQKGFTACRVCGG